MAQRMIGYAQAGRVPTAEDFAALMSSVDGEGAGLDRGQPYPFYLAQSWARPVEEMEPTLGPPQNWIAEWKFDGIRAQFVKRGGVWRLWSRGEELISDSYPELDALAERLPDGVAIDGELVVMKSPPEAAPTLLKASRRSRACSNGSAARRSARRRSPNCPSCSSPTICSNSAAATCAREPQHVRRAELAGLLRSPCARKRPAAAPQPRSRWRADWQALAAQREAARALGREGLMLKAREGAYGIGRRKGDDRTDVWWKWKLDPMSVDAVLIYAQRGHGRRSGVYSDYTFALWNARGRSPRELVPFAKAYSGLSDAEMREVDAIIRRTTKETFGPVRSVEPTLVFELGFEGLSLQQAPQERRRGAVSAHAALAARQAGRGSRHARQSPRLLAQPCLIRAPPRFEGWLEAKGWSAFPFQRETWKLIKQGKSGLLHATTGAGKTLARRLRRLAGVSRQPTRGGLTRALDHADARARRRQRALAARGLEGVAAARRLRTVADRRAHRRHADRGAQRAEPRAAAAARHDAGKPVADAVARGCARARSPRCRPSSSTNGTS